MTWDDLAKRVLEMTDGDRAKTVHYREPWDEAPEIFAVDVFEAKEDLTSAGGHTILKGDIFLQ